MMKKSQSLLDCTCLLVAASAIIIQKIDEEKLPISLVKDNDQGTATDSQKIETFGVDNQNSNNNNFTTPLKHDDYDNNTTCEGFSNSGKKINPLKIICNNLSLGYEKQALIQGYVDRIKRELTKMRKFIDLGQNQLNLDSVDSINSNQKVFYISYLDCLNENEFDESIMNYDLKGDISPKKRNSSINFQKVEISEKTKNLYRQLDFSSLKNSNSGVLNEETFKEQQEKIKSERNVVFGSNMVKNIYYMIDEYFDSGSR